MLLRRYGRMHKVFVDLITVLGQILIKLVYIAKFDIYFLEYLMPLGVGFLTVVAETATIVF